MRDFDVMITLNVRTQQSQTPLYGHKRPFDLLIVVGANLRGPFVSTGFNEFAYPPLPQLQLSIFALVFCFCFVCFFAYKLVKEDTAMGGGAAAGKIAAPGQLDYSKKVGDDGR